MPTNMSRGILQDCMCAYASAQPGRSLRFPPEAALDLRLATERSATTLVRLFADFPESSQGTPLPLLPQDFVSRYPFQGDHSFADTVDSRYLDLAYLE